MKTFSLFLATLVTAGTLTLQAGAASEQKSEELTAQNPSKPMNPEDAPALPPDVAKEKLNDAKIAQVLLTANQSEIEQSRLVLSAAQNRAVRDFAQTMITDHSQNTEMLQAILMRNDIKPKNSKTSRHLQHQAERDTRELQMAAKKERPRLYSTSARTMHWTLLQLIDGHLLPDVKNPELRTHLQKTRDKVSMHLSHAQHLPTTPEKTAAQEPELD